MLNDVCLDSFTVGESLENLLAVKDYKNKDFCIYKNISFWSLYPGANFSSG